jgi:hypothetical protein
MATRKIINPVWPQRGDCLLETYLPHSTGKDIINGAIVPRNRTHSQRRHQYRQTPCWSGNRAQNNAFATAIGGRIPWRKSKHKRTPKTVLKLPDLEQSKSAVMNSLTSASSKRSYDHAIREFIDWYCSEPRLAFNRTVVTRYRIALEQHPYAPSTINLRLAAIRRLAYEASDCGLLSSDLAAGIRRVKGGRRLGVRVGNWLTAEEGKKLLGTETAETLRSRSIRRI